MIVDKTGKIFDDRRITDRRINNKTKIKQKLYAETDNRKGERRKSK